MSNQIEIQTEPRESSGTADSRRLRHTGKVPAILYGAGKENENFVLDHDEMFHNLEKEGFVASILTVKTDKGEQQAILRDVQMHPYKPQVMHVDFLRIKESEAMTIKVPVHLIGEEEAPGIVEGGILTQSINEIDITCLPKDLPEYLEIDISELELNSSLHMSDLVFPEGVQLTGFMYIDEEDEQAMADANHAVVAIVPPRAPTEEPEEIDEELEEGAEGEEGTESEESTDDSASDDSSKGTEES